MEHKRLLPLVALAAAALVVATGCSLGGSSALPYEDDFSGDCGWPQKETSVVSAGCADGEYHVRVKQERNQVVSLGFGQHVDALRFETEASLEDGPSGPNDFVGYGVGCWTGDETTEEGGPDGPGYFFVVAPDGSYAIGRDPGHSREQELLVGRSAGALELRPGVNRIAGDCVLGDEGTTLVLRLNGDEVAVAKDPRGKEDFAWIGFVVATSAGDAEVRFDDIDARELSEDDARAAAARTPTPEESPTGLPVVDDFSDPSTGWATGEDELVSLAYADGAYRMRLKKSSPQWSLAPVDPSVEGLSVAATGTKVTGAEATELGVVCYASEEEGYIFAVNPSGGWEILKETPDDVVPLKSGAVNRAFGGVGTPISVEAQCSGSAAGQAAVLALTVNGREIARAKDKVGLSEFAIVGLFAWTKHQAEVGFDDFAARELTERESDALRSPAAAQPSKQESEGAGASLLYEERFTAKSSEWPEDHSASTAEYEGGGYRFLLKKPNTGYVVDQDLSAKVEQVVVEADARQADAGPAGQMYGIACKLDRGAGYSFVINADGGAYAWAIREEHQFNVNDLASGAGGTAITGPPATNHLRAECDGGGDGPTRLTFYVNGRKVGQAADRNGLDEFNSLALVAETSGGGAEVVFDNLVASRPR
jgi:hypothetical protein